MGALPPRATPRPAVVGAWIGLAVLLLCLAGCRTAADLDGGARGAPEHSPQALALAPSAEATVARPGPERPQLPGHSLGELRLHAARHNPGLRAAFERWKADLERIPQARSLPDPRFTYGYFIERVETRVGPQRHRFSLQQMLPWLPKLRLRGEVATREADAAHARFEAARLRLGAEVTREYVELYYLQQTSAALRDSMVLLQSWEETLLSRFQAAAAEHPDLIRVQVELGRLENRRESVEALVAPQREALNAVVGLPAGTVLPGSLVLPRQMQLPDEGELLSWAVEHNPELEALGHQVEREEAARRLARQESVPDLTVGLDYLETGPSLMPQDDSGKDPLMASVSINLPIWRSRYDALEREAEHRLAAAQLQHEDTRTRLVAQVARSIYGVQDAGRTLRLHEGTLLPKSEEALFATLGAYQAGKGSFLDLIDEQRTLLELQLAAERARADQVRHRANLEALVGRELDATEPGPVPAEVRDE